MIKKLKMLEEVNKKFNVDLSKTAIIATQHILETNFTMFNYMFKKGLKPKNAFLLGKCYSTNSKVMKDFQNKGVYVHPGSIKFDSKVPFDILFDKIMKGFITKVKKRLKADKFNKIILLDDGGFLVYWANKMLKKYNKKLIAIEQTSSGYHKLKNTYLHFPVINVARSKTKLQIESIFVAELLINKLNKLKIKPKKILIVGVGPVGDAIFRKLKNKFEVHTYDTIHHRSDLGKTSLTSVIGKFDLIIGCSGSPILNKKSYKYLKKGVTLVSASSSDREFSAAELRKGININNCHRNLNINGINLPNCGFPINFDGSRHSAAPKKIQLTRALMLAGVYLANSKKYKRGFVELDKSTQKFIVNKFKRL